MYRDDLKTFSQPSGQPSTTKSAVAVDEPQTWAKAIIGIERALNAMQVCDEKQKIFEHDAAYSKWLDFALTTKENQGTIYLIGNGASASMASHMAIDVMKNGGIRTMLFTDPAMMTALANDYSYDEVFSAPLRCMIRRHDLLVAISSSGESPNIVNACYTAQRGGANVVTLSGMEQGNTLSQLGHLNFYIPAPSYSLSETSHAAILHHWMDLISATAQMNVPQERYEQAYS